MESDKITHTIDSLKTVVGRALGTGVEKWEKYRNECTNPNYGNTIFETKKKTGSFNLHIYSNLLALVHCVNSRAHSVSFVRLLMTQNFVKMIINSFFGICLLSKNTLFGVTCVARSQPIDHYTK